MRLALAKATMVAACALALGCSDDDGNKKPTDDGGGNGKLWACSIPGEPCNPHDDCAIDPICGEDFLCKAKATQNCDDGLDCTLDSCGGRGLCINKPKEGFCAVLVKEGNQLAQPRCVAAGTPDPKDPCQICNPEADSERWSPRTGGSCDDGETCTENDTCQDGICRGTSFHARCADGLACTEDVCDGRGGCDNRLSPGYCIIAGECTKEGTRSGDGCSICDPKQKANVWTPLPSVCRIGGKCYADQELDGSGCGICDANGNPNDWSKAPDTCFIDGRCIKKGDKESGGCGVCDPDKSTSSYTLVADRCKIGLGCYAKDATSPSGCGSCDPQSPEAWSPLTSATVSTTTFESDAGSFSLDAAQGGVGWRLSSNRAKNGSQSLYYGDGNGESYDNGQANTGSAKIAVTLPAGQKSALAFWLYLDVENAEQSDLLSVLVDSEVVWTKGRSTVPATLYRQWTFIEVDLSKHAGKSVTLSLRFDSKDDWNNKGEGVFIDDVMVLTSCGAI